MTLNSKQKKCQPAKTDILAETPDKA